MPDCEDFTDTKDFIFTPISDFYKWMTPLSFCWYNTQNIIYSQLKWTIETPYEFDFLVENSDVLHSL